MLNHSAVAPRPNRRQWLAASAALALGAALAFPAEAQETIKVGILHSLSGTMAISETTLKDVMLMLIDEQNKRGGLLGKKLEAVVVDPASNWPLFAEKARELISKDKVSAVFGCWTSVSRKSVLPVFKELNSILFYPVQYEGEESERNVFYTGAAPNQQAIPAVDYLMKEEKVKRWVLAGTDYVYLSLAIEPGEMRAIIGPNGAGKTTMMDIVTGKTRPDEGDIYFDGAHDLTRLDETEIALLGIGRKFQKPTVFDFHTVEDNLLLALKSDRRARAALRWSEDADNLHRIDELLDTIRLNPLRARLAGSLSHGQKQWLEIGMLLAQQPKLLLVDEPVAGMTDAETRETADLLKQINRDRTVVVVEHDMTFVRDLSVKVTVLHEGAVIAEGTIDDVSNDERVIEVYLGR